VWLAFTHSHPLEHVGSDSQPNHSETHATCFCRNTSSALPHPFRPVAQAVVSLLTRVGRAQERRLKRIRRSLQQKKRELEEANAELKNERDALRKKAKRVSDEKATITQKAEATAMELDDTKEALDTTQAVLATTRKQLNNAKHHRKTVAADKRQAESERDAALEELEQLQTLADERLEAYEELEMEMVMMMMTDDVMAKRKRMNSAGGGGGGGDVDEGDELKHVDLFHEGRYDDNMRVAILACMRAGVGKDRIAPLVAALLRALANIKVNRMPAPSTIAKWADEMSNLTAIQLYAEFTTRMEATKVFAHDGTTMGGKKYGTAR
jgi:type I site-specific restriction endonuclease